MRIVSAAPAPERHARSARFERLGLAVTSVVLVFGLSLTYVEQTATFSTFDTDLQNGVIVNLNETRDGATSAITHVGALASSKKLSRADIVLRMYSQTGSRGLP